MSTFPNVWGTSWTNSASVNGTTLANAATLNSETLDNQNKSGTLISVSITYGGTATQGVNAYVAGTIDGTNFETVADLPWGVSLPYSASTTYHKTFLVSAAHVRQFQIILENNTGATVTASIKYVQNTVTQV